MQNRRELALLRLCALGLVGPQPSDPLVAVERLGALQAQDLPGALVSIALRIEGHSHAAVVDAFADGRLVRSWPMRGTLHVVAATDLGWILSLTGSRMLATSATRRTQVGITDAVAQRARLIADQVLSAGGPITRATLFGHWRDAGLLNHPQGGVHLLGMLCQEQQLVLGPIVGREQLVARLADWVPSPIQRDRETALAELARRYLRSHGPATAADLARWASLPITQARAGVAAVRDEFDTILLDGVEHLFAPELPQLLADHRREAMRLRLLPGFDEFILGYVDRSFAVPAGFEERLVPGGNGMFRASIVSGGRVVGTWKRGGTAARPSPVFEPFAALSATDEAAAQRAFAALPSPA